jgi:hypothetical protein
VSDDSAFAPEDVLSDVVIALGLPIVRTRPGCANFFELVCQALSYDSRRQLEGFAGTRVEEQRRAVGMVEIEGVEQRTCKEVK